MSVVGRGAELSSIHDFVANVLGGASALVLEGDAGVGKTTLWREGITDAGGRGVRVLQAQPSANETTLSFSGIGDLLDSVLDEALGQIPDPQRRVLMRTLVLEDDEGDTAIDRHAVGVSFLGALRALARTGPLLVAIDDVQWLDPAAADALGYAARRLRAEKVGLLLAHRTAVESMLLDELRRSLPSDRFRAVEVGPLDPGSLHRVIKDHLELSLPRPVVMELHEASGGNPFYALEIVRTLKRARISVGVGQPLPVPESLHDLVHGRLLVLPRESREFLLAAAALSHPTVALAEAATGVQREAGLNPALETHVVELDGDRIHFTHPLLAAGAYETANPLCRREVHARLAKLVEDPEARGRHLAASVVEPDEAVATALDEAAHRARARGAPRSAALLLDRAGELTPADRVEEANRRAVEAAYFHFESGDSPRAETQLRAVIAKLAPGRERARAMMQLARVRSYEAQAEAAQLYAQAVEEADDDREILAVAHAGVAAHVFERLDEGVEHAKIAASLAGELGDTALVAEALGTQQLLETLLGREAAAATASQALALQGAAFDYRVDAQPRCLVAVRWWWTDELREARETFMDLLERAIELGDESSMPFVLMLVGHVECALGELDSAVTRAQEGQASAEQAGQSTHFAHHLALESLVESMRGHEDRARKVAAEALRRTPEMGGWPAELVAREALGHLELALGSPEAAVAWLEPSVAFVHRRGMAEPGAMIRFVIDEIEALIELGLRNEAVKLLDWYEGNAQRLKRASAIAACLRCRGLLAAQAGALNEALTAYEEALEWHERVEIPLDRGRTLLVLGATQRRAKRRREARETLKDALEVFERIGAILWSDRARAELRRISGRAPSAGALTPVEERVAALVAEGKTNREVAAALFLSERTVEGHLSHVFGKLGVRSRTELTRALSSHSTGEVAGPNTGDSPVSRRSSAS